MRKNLLTMTGTLDQCLLFMYRCPVEAVRHLVPKCLEIMTYKGYAIIGVVVSQLKQMRPWPAPGWMGLGYRHVAFRIYVSYTPPGEQPIEGLYFLRSDADSRLMKIAGNVLTDFRFHHAKIEMDQSGNRIQLDILQSDDQLGSASASLLLDKKVDLSNESCFESLEEAMAVLHYEPYGIFYDPDRKKVNVIKVTRDDSKWRERPVYQDQAQWTYLNHIVPNGLVHELTIMVDSIPYRWERGREFTCP